MHHSSHSVALFRYFAEGLYGANYGTLALRGSRRARQHLRRPLQSTSASKIQALPISYSPSISIANQSPGVENSSRPFVPPSTASQPATSTTTQPSSKRVKKPRWRNRTTYSSADPTRSEDHDQTLEERVQEESYPKESTPLKALGIEPSKLRTGVANEGRAQLPPVRSNEDGTMTPREREEWQIQKEALKRKFGETGWNPRKRLSPDALEGIRSLHAQYSETYTTPVLAEHFKVSPEAIRRILKSKWKPNEEQEEDRRRRWDKRGETIWSSMVELGVKPPKKWREMGIGRRIPIDESRPKRKPETSFDLPKQKSISQPDRASQRALRSLSDRIV
ncbi:MAG: Required for respiratory growth protein 9 mitochondrial [Icmadophila ericetorum]|nr:Required for respiratory growth protein 9 mitochondrial [Icmadophila ericetorum]